MDSAHAASEASTVKWRVERKALPPRTVRDVFPDVDKMPIAKALAEWGIDVGDHGVEIYFGDTSAAWVEPTGTLFIDPRAMSYNYPTSEDKYLMLSHELSHFLHMVEDRTDERAYEMARSGAKTPKMWISLEHERDAMRWMARQAKLMGWPKKRFVEFVTASVSRELEDDFRSITRSVYSGKFPEERGVRPMFRRPPIRVRSHRRRQ